MKPTATAAPGAGSMSQAELRRKWPHWHPLTQQTPLQVSRLRHDLRRYCRDAVVSPEIAALGSADRPDPAGLRLSHPSDCRRLWPRRTLRQDAARHDLDGDGHERLLA